MSCAAWMAEAAAHCGGRRGGALEGLELRDEVVDRLHQLLQQLDGLLDALAVEAHAGLDHEVAVNVAEQTREAVERLRESRMVGVRES